jgi:hypothetical protein
MTLDQARRKGRKWYTSNRLCKNGHVSKRLVSNQECYACARERRNRYYHRTYNAAWKIRNPGRLAELNRIRLGLPAPSRPMPTTCECCGGAPNGQGRTLHYDHCHVTGAFRGWLCASCNTAIGKLGDNLQGVYNAVRYLTPASDSAYTHRH